MALFKNTNMTDSGGRKKKEPENPTPPVPPVVEPPRAETRGMVDKSRYLDELNLNLQNQGGNNGGNSGTPKTPAYQSTATPSYSPNADRGNLDAALASKPKDFDYDQYGRILGMMQEYQGREPFSYDLNADMLYQQYKNQYMRNGQRAMQDTVGQVSALNGGYASSYAQTAGQQAYNNELGKLNDVIPELYQLAYSKYAREGDEMLKGIELANDAYKTRYDEYRDAMTDWRNDVARAQSMYEDQRDFDYRVYADDIARAQNQQQIDIDNYRTALSVAQGNAGNKEGINSTLSALVKMGVIDQETASSLANTYGDYVTEGTTDAGKTPEYKYDTHYKFNEDEIMTAATAEEAYDNLQVAVANGWISKEDSYNLFKRWYNQQKNKEPTPEEIADKVSKYGYYFREVK